MLTRTDPGVIPIVFAPNAKTLISLLISLGPGVWAGPIPGVQFSSCGGS